MSSSHPSPPPTLTHMNKMHSFCSAFLPGNMQALHREAHMHDTNGKMTVNEKRCRMQRSQTQEEQQATCVPHLQRLGPPPPPPARWHLYRAQTLIIFIVFPRGRPSAVHIFLICLLIPLGRRAGREGPVCARWSGLIRARAPSAFSLSTHVRTNPAPCSMIG